VAQQSTGESFFMGNFSPQFDAYIAKSPAFSQPILRKLRALFHQACPEIQEVMKWSMPFFDYKGIVANIAAFKQHVRFGFWKGKLLQTPAGALDGLHVSSLSMWMAKITSIKDLPKDAVILDLIRQAVALNEAGVKAPMRKKAKKPAKLVIPTDFGAALKKNKKASAAFGAFSPSKQREYVEWITEAKQDATRNKRLATAIEWITEGKSLRWKYEK
jgi:uncharacterized protein YdeI (YjbR/CyaY-like superfamily)